MSNKLYTTPFGYIGIGSDIKWCSRWKGGKFCMYCGHYVKFEEWSKLWHWYYLLEWTENHNWSWPYRERAHYKIPSFYGIHNVWRWGIRGSIKKQEAKPKRYGTVGLKETDLKSLLRKGCKKNRKCKCVSVSQRGAWYCPECYFIITRLAKYKNTDFHNLTITDKNELKEEILILLLSGTI